MNDRIRERALQAGIVSRKHAFGRYWEGDLTPEQKKFAELIVQDCITQARTQMYNNDEIASEEDPLLLKLSLASNVGVESAVEAIQQHFGIEE